MTSSPPDLNDLALLVLVAETGSIGQAAHRLDLTQPSVSRRLGALERRLGVPLLSRSRQGSTLTPAGRVVVDWAAVLLDAADDFTRSVRMLRTQAEGSVHAAASMTIAEHYAPEWLGNLRDEDPDIVVTLSVANSTDVAEMVEQRKVDIGFLESPTVRRGLWRRRVGVDHLLVAVTPDHPWSRGRGVSAEELASARLLVRESGSGTRETLEHALASHGLALQPGMEMASNTALKSAAVAGMGPVVLSALSLTEELGRGQLVQVPVAGVDLVRPLTAVWRRDHDLAPGCAALLATARRGSTGGAGG